MIRLFALLVLAALMSYSSEAKKIEGYFINHNNRKVTVTWLIPFGSEPKYQRLQQKITYIKDDREEILYPQDAKEVVFLYEDKTFRMVSVYDNIGLSSSENDPELFLHLELDGRMRVLHYYVIDTNKHAVNERMFRGKNASSSFSCHLLQFDKAGYMTKVSLVSPKNDLLEAFEGCVELVEKVKVTEKPDTLEMVKLYNETCK